MSSPAKNGQERSEPAMGALIPMINKLQDVFNILGSDNKIDLPQIVVVGSQSAGKSSVLESICRRDFLPRGSGIVTRRPLILQLFKTNGEKIGDKEEWGEFLHRKGEKITDMEAIRSEIEADTAKLCGTGQCVVDEPIRLKFFSPHVLNLTLVDLPGIARNPVGDQPKNIEFLIKDMVMKYISKPNALILAVTAANTDLATSDAISMSHSVDPTGERTIGVLTKVDLMDRGTNAYRILTNREYPLKLGWTGVVNRSQADIDGKKGIATARNDEMAFFRSSERYRDIADTQGTDYLSYKLNRILIQHIQKNLPVLNARISEMYEKTLTEFQSYGASISEEEKPGTVLQLISSYAQEYDNMIEGRTLSPSTDMLFGGARIAYIFDETLGRMLDALDPLKTVSVEEIRTMVRNVAGARVQLFIPMRVLEVLAQRVVRSLEKPSLRAVDLVLTELIAFSKACVPPPLKRFVTLSSRLMGTAEKMLEALAVPCRRYVHDTIMCELSLINANHPDFRDAVTREMRNDISGAPQTSATGGVQGQPGPGAGTTMTAAYNAQSGMASSAAAPSSSNPFLAVGAISPTGVDPFKGDATTVSQLPKDIRVSGQWTDDERRICELIPRLLSKYYHIIRKKIQDTVPKAVMYFLVCSSQEHMQKELVAKLYVPSRISALLDEDPEIERRRRACSELLAMLRKAQEIIKDVETMR